MNGCLGLIPFLTKSRSLKQGFRWLYFGHFDQSFSERLKVEDHCFNLYSYDPLGIDLAFFVHTMLSSRRTYLPLNRGGRIHCTETERCSYFLQSKRIFFCYAATSNCLYFFLHTIFTHHLLQVSARFTGIKTPCRQGPCLFCSSLCSQHSGWLLVGIKE